MRRPWALPLVPLYAAGSRLRWIGLKPERLQSRVVSIGSLSAGGAGKTPFVIALAKAGEASGHLVDVLSRGYGRSETAAVEVDPAGSADVFGDEPLLIAREAQVPVFVGALRFEAGRLAEEKRRAELEGQTPWRWGDPDAKVPEQRLRVHLLDDGFQHRQLYRDVDIVLVSSADLKDWLLPAGNRREPLSALRRATAFAVEEGDDAAVERLMAMKPRPLHGWTIWRYAREMIVPEIEGPVVAFCGIARPGQFWKGLEQAGVEVAAKQAFVDHHRFSEEDLVELRKMALESGAVGFVTTAKDAVRLGGLQERLGLPVVVADLRVTFPKKNGPWEGLWGWRGLLT